MCSGRTTRMIRFGIFPILLCWVFAVGNPSPLSAQTLQDSNFHNWLMYFGDHPVSDHWGIHLEGQFRRTNGGLAPQQLLLRPGVNYQVTPHLMLTADMPLSRPNAGARRPRPHDRFHRPRATPADERIGGKERSDS